MDEDTPITPNETTNGAPRERRFFRRRKEPVAQWRIPTTTAVLMILVVFLVFDSFQVVVGTVGMVGGAAYMASVEGQPLVRATMGVIGFLDWIVPDWLEGPSVEVADNVTITGFDVASCWTGVGCARAILKNAAQWAVGETIDEAKGLILAFFMTLVTVVSWLIAFLGMLVMGLWLALRGVSIFSGSMIGRKVAISFATVSVTAFPLINIVPEMTIWIAAIIYLSWREDKEKHDTLLAKHRADEEKMQRAQLAGANDNEPFGARQAA